MSSAARAAILAEQRGDFFLPRVVSTWTSSDGMDSWLVPRLERRALLRVAVRHATEPENSPRRPMCWLAVGRHDDAVTTNRPSMSARFSTGRIGRWSASHPWRALLIWFSFVAACLALGAARRWSYRAFQRWQADAMARLLLP
jgi:hypothetical protein